MSEKLFLYVDILGFSALVRDDAAMAEIFERVDRLNVHRDRDFGVIVFSDTMLVYAGEGWMNAKSQAVMWLVEFAQDLFYRFVGIDRHFRAYLTMGEFTHTKKQNIEAYYGEALVECYEKEKSIKAMGVFMANKLVPYSDILHTTPFDEDCHFVHIMQRLDHVSRPGYTYPLPPELLWDTDLDWLIAYDVVYLSNIHRHMSDSALGDSVRQKYAATWNAIRSRHPALLDALVASAFDPHAVCNVDWSEPLRRVGTEDGFFG